MRCSLLLAAAALFVSNTAYAQAPTHPLDGLSAREHWIVYDALIASGKTDSTTRYLYEGLREPPKADVLAWRPGQPFARMALVHLMQDKRGYEAVVDINAKKLVSWTEVPGRQYMTSRAEDDAADALAMKDARVLAAFARRGVKDLTHVGCSPANHGYFDLPEERGHRVVHLTCGDDHGRYSGYGETFEGLIIVADLTDDKILRVLDTGAQPSTGAVGDHDVEAVGALRPTKNPVTMVQPLGPSFTLDGQQVSWQNWKFQFRVDPRRGIVLSMVRYTDGGKDRSVMYQGSLSELFVPYMDPHDAWNYQGYFDLGTYPSNFGGVASALEPGVECPVYGVYFNSVVVTEKGRPRERPRTACLFERSAGDVAWRHSRDGGVVVESRAKRDLVLRMFMTAGNYDYLFDWVFQQDGTIQVNVGATGMDQTKGIAGTSEDELYGRLIAPNLIGVNHSHFFSFRLDLDVDGTSNSLMVDRLKTTRLPDSNPRRSIWTVQTQRGADRVRGGAALDHERAGDLADREPGGEGGVRVAGGVSDRRPWGDDAAERGRLHAAAGRVHQSHALGDSVQRPGRRAVRRRRLSDGKHRGGGTAQVDGGQPPDRQHGRGGVAHDGVSPRAEAGGLAGDAGGVAFVRDPAGGVLQPESGD